MREVDEQESTARRPLLIRRVGATVISDGYRNDRSSRTRSSRQRNRMPAIEVETDGRETQPAPPRLTHFGPRWVVSLSTSCCGPMAWSDRTTAAPRRAKSGRRNHRDRRYIALPCALPNGAPRTLGRVNAAGRGQDGDHCDGSDQFSAKHSAPAADRVLRVMRCTNPAPAECECDIWPDPARLSARS
jgi:hypothetical protein